MHAFDITVVHAFDITFMGINKSFVSINIIDFYCKSTLVTVLQSEFSSKFLK